MYTHMYIHIHTYYVRIQHVLTCYVYGYINSNISCYIILYYIMLQCYYIIL